MIIILIVTAGIILLYFLYPFFLRVYPNMKMAELYSAEEIDGVTLVLLTYNGVDFLKDKINFLRKEISTFKNAEFIIIDDNSNDGTKELLNQLKESINFTLIQKKCQKGIPDSMNIAVKQSKYDYLIFCDQRQKLSENILKKIVIPLSNITIGAVSCCVSDYDINNNPSLLRKHENGIKFCESNIGCLVGVYGPLYALRKSCFSEIPPHIVLDDLYLSLKVLRNHKIVLIRNCNIVDGSFSDLYNFNRSKRYLKGLIQLLFEKKLIWSLNGKLQLMLFWHKYMRLFIPLLLFTSYAWFAVYSIIFDNSIFYLIIVTAIVLLFFVISCFKVSLQISEVTRTVCYYFFSFISLILSNINLRKET